MFFLAQSIPFPGSGSRELRREHSNARDTRRCHYITIDMKRAPLPVGSSEWLFMRIESRIVCGGRMDIDVLICDDAMYIVARRPRSARNGSDVARRPHRRARVVRIPRATNLS